MSLRTLVSVLLIALTLLSCGGGVEQESVTPPPTAPFREVAQDTGLDFEYFVGASGDYYLPEIMSGGVVMLDYDGDGDQDVFFTQGTILDPKLTPEQAQFAPPKTHWPGHRLFRNELVPSGTLRFTDVTEEAGVGHVGYGVGAAAGDFDNDGDPDLYVTVFGDNTFFRNNGDGTFTDVTGEVGARESRWSTSASFFDYDGDGDLDLFVVNYVDFTVSANKDCYDTAGSQDYCSPAVYMPMPDRLFRNDGGRFTDVSGEAGLGAAYGSGLGVSAADINLDGWMDIVVANDGNANQVWENQGDGTFEDIALFAGMAYNAHGQAEAGMGITLGDIDNDGDEDILMAHLAGETFTLYENTGGGMFEDSTDAAGLGSSSYPFTGFGAHFFDYDHDGWSDLLVVNGAVTIVEAQRSDPFPFLQPTLLYRNRGGGRFEVVDRDEVPALAIEETSRGAAYGDIDNDGDIDVVASNANGKAHLLLNEAGRHRPWLMLRLMGVANNLDGIGTRVAVLRAGKPALWRRVHRDGSFASSNDVRAHFGLGDEASFDGVGVIWPNGAQEMWPDLEANRLHTLREGSGSPWSYQLADAAR